MKDKFYTFMREIGLFALQLKKNLLSMKIKRNEEVECRNIVVRQERERRMNLMKNNQRLLERHKAR